LIVRALLTEIIANEIVYEKEISFVECSYLEDNSYLREASLVSTSTPVRPENFPGLDEDIITKTAKPKLRMIRRSLPDSMPRPFSD